MTRTTLHHRLKALAGRGLRGIYRNLLAARYAGVVNAERQPGGARSILVVRGDAIGDFVLFLPALRVLRQHYASAKISLVVASECADLASSFAPVDEVIEYDRKRYRFDLAYRIRLIRSLRARQFDVALNPVYSREPLTDELLYCCGAQERIACEGDLSNIRARTKTGNNAFCSRIYPSSTGLLHESERNREFVERLIGTHGSAEDFQPSLSISQPQLKDACALLRGQGLDPHKDLIVAMFPGASKAIKRWPAENFAQLADDFSRSFGARVLLCGASSDRKWGQTVSKLAEAAPVTLIGDTTLTQLTAVLRLSALYIGNDSGPLHLAVAAGTPSLAIMGGGHFYRFYPYSDPNRHRMAFKEMDCYNCNWQCIHETVRCIQEISVQHVWVEAKKLMEEVVLPQRLSRESAWCSTKLA